MGRKVAEYTGGRQGGVREGDPETLKNVLTR